MQSVGIALGHPMKAKEAALSIFRQLFKNRNETWTLYAQLSRLAGGVVFLIVLAAKLPPEMLAAWYVFVSIFSLIAIVELGANQTIGRHAAYLLSDLQQGKINVELAKHVAFQLDRTYTRLVIGLATVAVPIGYVWIINVVPSLKGGETALAWFLYVYGSSLLLKSSLYSALLNGAGEMWKAQRAVVITSVLNCSVIVVAALLPVSLLGPSLALAISQSAGIAILRWHYRDRWSPSFSKQFHETAYPYLRDTWRDSKKMLWLLIYYQSLTNIFFMLIVWHVPAETAASYGLTMQIAGIVMTLATIWSQSSFFSLSKLHRQQQAVAARATFKRAIILTITACGIGLLAVGLIGTYALKLINAKNSLLPTVLLSLVLTTIFLEFGQNQFSQFLVASGDLTIYRFMAAAGSIITACVGLLLYLEVPFESAYLLRPCLYALGISLPTYLMFRKLWEKL